MYVAGMERVYTEACHKTNKFILNQKEMSFAVDRGNIICNADMTMIQLILKSTKFKVSK